MVEEAADQGFLVAAAGERMVVATVNGVPVHDDCVARQAGHAGIEARAALDQCVDFELLAQAAQTRGFGRHPEVSRTARKELVRRLLDEEIVDEMPSLAQTERAVLEDAYKRWRKRIYRPYLREVVHVFAPFAERGMAKASPGDIAARAFAEEIHAALADRRGLSKEDLYEAAREVAGERTLGPMDASGAFRYEIFKVALDSGGLPRTFTEAVFEIPKPGMVSLPARSDHGWHIILLMRIEPERFGDVDAASEFLFEAVRSERYRELLQSLMDGSDVTVHESAFSLIVDDTLSKMAEERR